MWTPDRQVQQVQVYLKNFPHTQVQVYLKSVLEKNRKKIAPPRCVGLFFTTLVPTTLVPIMPTCSDTSTLSTHTAMGRYTKYRYTCPNHTDRYKTGTSIVQVSAIQVHSGTSIRYTRTRFRPCLSLVHENKIPYRFFLF